MGEASPNVLKHSTVRPEVRLHLAPELHARHGAPGGEALLRFEDEGIAVFEGEPPAADDVGPVYRDRSGGELCVPTGRLFVRCAEDDDFAAKTDAVEAAGYAVVEVPAYAPHCAWLVARSGRIEDALNGIPGLEEIDGVVNVEPQMLRRRALR